MFSRRVRFVVNPSARSGRAQRAARLARCLARRETRLQTEWIISRSAEHLRDLVRSAQQDDLDALVLAGGDGTVALAVDSLDGPNRVPLGVLPVGSGNDFARDLGVLPGSLDIFATAGSRWVDIARAGQHGPRFGCVASVGLDEMALRLIHGSWLPRSKALNILSALRALWSYRPRAVRVVWEGGAFEDEVMFVAVTNTRSYGGGFLISPEARLDDGRLDLCIVRRTSRSRLLWHFPRILTGTHGGLSEVIQATSPWVRIEGIGDELSVALDGELPRLYTPIEFRCEPSAVQVLAPAGRT